MGLLWLYHFESRLKAQPVGLCIEFRLLLCNYSSQHKGWLMRTRAVLLSIGMGLLAGVLICTGKRAAIRAAGQAAGGGGNAAWSQESGRVTATLIWIYLPSIIVAGAL